MTPEVMRRALDPFYTTKRRGLGTGMGLSLVNGIITAAGGSVHLDAEPGRGAKVLLKLPLDASGDGDGAKSPVASAGHAVVTVRDARIASIAASLLETAGFDVAHRAAPGSGEDWAVWVTDQRPSPDQMSALAPHDHRQVIVVGEASEIAPNNRLRFVRESDDFEALRRSIREARTAVNGGSDHAKKDPNSVCG